MGQIGVKIMLLPLPLVEALQAVLYCGPHVLFTVNKLGGTTHSGVLSRVTGTSGVFAGIANEETVDDGPVRITSLPDVWSVAATPATTIP